MVIEMIKQKNPNWVESDGACTRCINYYVDLDNAVEVYD